MMLIEETSIPDAALPVDAFKAHLRLGTGFGQDGLQDEVLKSFLRAAIAAIEARTGKVLIARAFSWTLNAWRDRAGQVLPLAPVRALTALVLVDPAGQETDIALSTVRLERDAQRPRLRPMASLLPMVPAGGSVRVTFDAGFAPDWDGLDGASVMPLQHVGLAALHGAAWRATPELFDPDLGAQIECGLALDGVAVSRAHHASHRIGTILSAFLTRFDAILVPTTPCAAWPVGQVAPTEIAGVPCGPRDHAAFTPQANHAGCPAISIPCGATADGLPLGLQVIAARGRDAGLLALASQIAQRLAGPEQEKVP